MNAAHLHLILNHLPVLGEVGGAVMLLAGMKRRSPLTVRVALLSIIASGALAVPVFLSGRRAADVVGRVDGVMQEAIDPHEEAATAFLIAAITAGVLAAIALAAPRTWITPVALAASLIASFLGVRAADLGGRIHHPEIAGARGRLAITSLIVSGATGARGRSGCRSAPATRTRAAGR